MTPAQWAENLLAQGYKEVEGFIGWGYTLNPGDKVKKIRDFGYESKLATVEKVFARGAAPHAAGVIHDDIQLILRNADGTYDFVPHHRVKKVNEGE